MTNTKTHNASERVCRVDKFIVPPQSCEAFVEKLKSTHALLKTMDGFVQDFVLQQCAGPGKFNVVTLVEWENAASIEKAKAIMAARYKKENFNPQEMFARLDITADRGDYQRIDTTQEV